MKYEKFIVSITTLAVLTVTIHESIAAEKISKSAIQNEIASVEKDLKINAKKNVSKTKKNKLSQKSPQKSIKKKITPTKKSYVTKDPIVAQANRKQVIAAVNNPVRTESVIQDLSKTKSSTTSAKTSTVKKEATPSSFSGSVEMAGGRDTNVGGDKYDLKSNFYRLSPTLGYKGESLETSFGAVIQDYADSELSNNYKENSAFINGSFNAKVSNSVSSKTSLGVTYYDTRQPDYINIGDFIVGGTNPGLPLRYTEASIGQSFTFAVNNKVTSEIGATALRRESYDLTTDFSPQILNTVDTDFEGIYEKDYNKLSAFGKITLGAASFLDISAKPSVSQLRYDSGSRNGRCPDGQGAGTSACGNLSDNYELITSELAIETAFKWGASNITPKAVVGLTSDEALGAEDNSFYGIGFSSSLLLHARTGLTVTPNIMYKKINYDNFRNGVANGETRVDDETSGGIDAKINLTKNLSLATGIAVIREESTKFNDRSENYKQQIYTTGLTFSF